MTRRRARIAVLESLFQIDSMRDEDLDEDVVRNISSESLRRNGVSDAPLQKFARCLIRGVFAHGDDFGAAVGERAHSWSLHRIGKTERLIIYMAMQEIAWMDTPAAVAIDEAVELTKSYVSESAASFVNGILDAFAKECGGEKAEGR